MKTAIPGDRVLHMALPEDVGPGQAEVIVLLADEAAAPPAAPLAEVLRSVPLSPADARTREQIDQSLRQEREAWGDR